MPKFVPIGRALSERHKNSSLLDENMVPRTANRNKERLMAFLNGDGDFVSATTIVGPDGKIANPAVVPGKLDLIHEELVKLNLHLTLITGNEV